MSNVRSSQEYWRLRDVMGRGLWDFYELVASE
jgi:hypothetical protein